MALTDGRSIKRAIPIERIAANDLIKMLEGMHLLRAFDRKVGERCKRGEIPGLIHLGLGEEAVAVGACVAIEPTDKVTSTHRAHGHFLAKGGDPKALMAELYGKQTGCCKGKGGSMHLIDLEIGFLGANGVVGAGLPIAVGAALGQRMLAGNGITICFFGDGANNQGTFHESLNLAAIWDLPVVFVCENNEYGISLITRDQQKVRHVADRGCAYGMPTRVTDGNDVLEVYDAVSNAADLARRGKGPTLIECKTYRISGHYEGDSQSYRPKKEVEAWRRKDPIRRLEKTLLDRKILGAAKLDEIRNTAQRIVDEAVAFAEDSPFPAPEAAETDVFGEDHGVAI